MKKKKKKLIMKRRRGWWRRVFKAGPPSTVITWLVDRNELWYNFITRKLPMVGMVRLNCCSDDVMIEELCIFSNRNILNTEMDTQ